MINLMKCAAALWQPKLAGVAVFNWGRFQLGPRNTVQCRIDEEKGSSGGWLVFWMIDIYAPAMYITHFTKQGSFSKRWGTFPLLKQTQRRKAKRVVMRVVMLHYDPLQLHYSPLATCLSSGLTKMAIPPPSPGSLYIQTYNNQGQKAKKDCICIKVYLQQHLPTYQ